VASTSLFNSILTPGWTTSAPGDMKNTSGLTTRFAKQPGKPAPASTSASTYSWDSLDALSKAMREPISQEQFKKEYLTSFEADNSNASFKAPPPKIDRDTPESSEGDAW
jgi:hypothetical protein